MRYITHRRFKDKAACGDRLNLPYGTELEADGDFLFTLDGRHVCYITSETTKQYFSRNDDGLGLRRGALTWAIAYANRDGGNGFRFSDRERELLERDWGRWLRQDTETILFNEDFFEADPAELQQLADALHIKARR